MTEPQCNYIYRKTCFVYSHFVKCTCGLMYHIGDEHKCLSNIIDYSNFYYTYRYRFDDI